MSSFFTLPASQRKRKRDERSSRPTSKTTDRKANGTSKKSRREDKEDDDSISGSDSDSGDGRRVGADEDVTDLTSSDSDEDEDDETHASRRTKLASRYLENTRREILAEGFDAKDIDDELLAQRMGERLKEDTAESKGRIYRFIADDYTYSRCRVSRFSNGTGTVTDVAVCAPHVYTVSSDARLSKWEVAQEGGKAVLVKSVRGDRKRRKDPAYSLHTNEIYCVAASQDGKYIATGGKDRKLVVWNAKTLEPLRAFTNHRDAIMALALRRGTNQLFTAGRDRTVKIWSLDELAYIETLYGHQDEIVDVASLTQEHCITVGARDRTARFWKVVEENQLIFNGGGARNSLAKKRRDAELDQEYVPPKNFHEGSIDRVVMLDEETFITGSDNGSLSLWSIQKKKPVFTYPLAHGIEPAKRLEDISAEISPDPKSIPEAQPRWITALAGVPFSNVFFSGSWDGCVRAWKVTQDRREIEALGVLEAPELIEFAMTKGQEEEEHTRAPGVVNGLDVFETGPRGKETLNVVAATGKQHRSGRWAQKLGRNAAVLYRIPRQGL